MNEPLQNAPSASTTTMQDLPIEILDYILMKAAIKVVRDGKLAKCTWKQKIVPVINRMRTVWSQWNFSLTTRWFGIVLERNLDSLDPVPICVKTLGGLYLKEDAQMIATNRNEMFIGCSNRIYIYDCNDLTKVKTVTHVKTGIARELAACELSDSLYVLCIVKESYVIYQFKKEGDQYVQTSTIDMRCVSSPGRKLALQVDGSSYTQVDDGLLLFKADGSLQRRIPVPSSVLCVRHVLQKSNGKFVVLCAVCTKELKLLEIDMNGQILHEFSIPPRVQVSVTLDLYDRVIIVGENNILIILGDEFNTLEVSTQHELWEFPSVVHYDLERNEMLVVTGPSPHMIFRDLTFVKFT